MPETSNPVGDAIKAAVERGRELSRSSPRRPNVRVMSPRGEEGGLTISARIAARTPQELDAQDGLGVRCVAWEELDARAGDLVALVEAVVSEVEHAIAAAPACESNLPDDLGDDAAAMDLFSAQIGGALTRAALPMLDKPSDGLSDARRLEALMGGLLRVAALTAHTMGLSPSGAQDMLRNEIARLSDQSHDGARHIQLRAFDA